MESVNLSKQGIKDVVMVSLSSQTEKGFCCQLTVGAIAILIEF